LRHVATEDLDQLAPLLTAGGYQIRYFDVGVESFIDVSPLDAELVIVLGGPVAVYDSESYPWLRAEVAWLRARLLEDLP
ncbi:glutamine amidotransferase, partial [Salmonella enterica]